MKWSILICTLANRAQAFQQLHDHLSRQIQQAGLHGQVEILHSLDNREHSVGAKRNALHRQARGEYLCFVDDDDKVADWYVQRIFDGLSTNPDCVSLTGIITQPGKNPRTFIHSVRYDRYFEENNVYYRPPNHLNPIRSSLARSVPFPDRFHGEDTDWALQLCRRGVLRDEFEINEPYYFYLFDPRKSETFRHMKKR